MNWILLNGAFSCHRSLKTNKCALELEKMSEKQRADEHISDKKKPQKLTIKRTVSLEIEYFP